MRTKSIAAICGIFTFALAQTAFAAPPSPWSGFYVGGNFGYSWGRTGTDIVTGGTGNGTLNASDTISMNNVIGGGQVGFNYRFGRMLLAGIEADFQGSAEKGGNTLLVCTTGGGGCDVITSSDTYSEKLQWFGTVRGRLGYIVNPTWMVYATGGLAYGRLTRDDTYTNTNGGVFVGTQTSSLSGVKTGWALGGGAEMAFWGNWTGRVEYLYINLAGLGTTANLPIAGGAAFMTASSKRFTDGIVRVAVNYSFGGL